jgi:hypothetical protein
VLNIYCEKCKMKRTINNVKITEREREGNCRVFKKRLIKLNSI